MPGIVEGGCTGIPRQPWWPTLEDLARELGMPRDELQTVADWMGQLDPSRPLPPERVRRVRWEVRRYRKEQRRDRKRWWRR
jgi:hypothetical protein